MNTLHAIYALSTVGAAAFYAAGFLTRSRDGKASAAPALSVVASTELEQELEAIRQQLEASQSEARNYKLALDVTQKQKEAAFGEYEREKKARAAAEAARAQLETQVTSLQAQFEDARASRDKSAADDLARTSGLLETERKARREAEQALASERQKLGVRQQELERIRGDLAKATAGAAAGAAVAKASLHKSQPDHQRVERELRSQIEALRTQVSDHEKRNTELERQVARAQSDSSALRERADRVASLEQQLEQARSQGETLQADIHRLERELAQVEREATDLREASASRAADVEGLRQENVELRDLLARQQSSDSASQDLQRDVKRLKIDLDVALRKAATADELRKELEDLQDKLRVLQDKEPDGDEGTREQARQLGLDLSVAFRRISDLQSSAEEAASLREQVRMLSGALEEADRLRRRVRSLESIAIASGSPSEPEEEQATESKGVAPEARSLLDQELAAVASAQNIRSVALADQLGLLVAAGGESSHHEGMAAMAGLVSEFAGRTVDYVPLSKVRRLHLVDSNNVVLSCEMLQWHQDPVVMITLSAGMPSTTAIGATVAALAEAGLSTP